MKAKSLTETLNEEIRLLERKQVYELQSMHQQFHQTVEELKPGNLLRSTFQNIVSKPSSDNKIIDGSIGLVTGYLSRKFLFGTSTNPVKKIIGTILQLGITTVAAKNSIAIKAVGGTILSAIFKKKKDKEQVPILSNVATP